jgi:hypothetical protein
MKVSKKNRGLKFVTVERKGNLEDSIISVSRNGREIFRGSRKEWNRQ